MELFVGDIVPLTDLCAMNRSRGVPGCFAGETVFDFCIVGIYVTMLPVAGSIQHYCQINVKPFMTEASDFVITAAIWTGSSTYISRSYIYQQSATKPNW